VPTPRDETTVARNMNMSPDAPVYRAVVTRTYPSGEVRTWCEGPYATAGAAQARVTFWINDCRVYDDDLCMYTGESWATGHVDTGTVSWSSPVSAGTDGCGQCTQSTPCAEPREGCYVTPTPATVDGLNWWRCKICAVRNIGLSCTACHFRREPCCHPQWTPCPWSGVKAGGCCYPKGDVCPTHH
jgi:hypothetical protein